MCRKPQHLRPVASTYWHAMCPIYGFQRSARSTPGLACCLQPPPAMLCAAEVDAEGSPDWSLLFVMLTWLLMPNEGPACSTGRC